MIGFDSNVLVRYLVKDDPHQAQLALAIVRSRTALDPGWVSLPVLMELVWVLEHSYKQNKPALIHVVERLLGSQDIVLEREAVVAGALRMFSSGSAGFSDCVIALLARAAGCDRVVTFDRFAARDAGMELLK